MLTVLMYGAIALLFALFQMLLVAEKTNLTVYNDTCETRGVKLPKQKR